MEWSDEGIVLSARRHGEAAAMRHDELLEAGGVDGCAVWKRILKAIDELQSEERLEAACVHPNTGQFPHAFWTKSGHKNRGAMLPP